VRQFQNTSRRFRKPFSRMTVFGTVLRGQSIPFRRQANSCAPSNPSVLFIHYVSHELAFLGCVRGQHIPLLLQAFPPSTSRGGERVNVYSPRRECSIFSPPPSTDPGHPLVLMVSSKGVEARSLLRCNKAIFFFFPHRSLC